MLSNILTEMLYLPDVEIELFAVADSFSEVVAEDKNDLLFSNSEDLFRLPFFFLLDHNSLLVS